MYFSLSDLQPLIAAAATSSIGIHAAKRRPCQIVLIVRLSRPEAALQRPLQRNRTGPDRASVRGLASLARQPYPTVFAWQTKPWQPMQHREPSGGRL